MAIIEHLHHKKSKIEELKVSKIYMLYFLKIQFYRLINLEYFDLKNINLRRKVKYKLQNYETQKDIVTYLINTDEQLYNDCQIYQGIKK